MFSVASVCLSVCNALSFDSLHLDCSFLMCNYVFRISRSKLFINVIREKKPRPYVQFAGNLPSADLKAVLFVYDLPS